MGIVIDPAMAVGYLLALIRAIAWVMIIPPFATRSIPTRIKLGLATALTLGVGDGLSEQAVSLDAADLIMAAGTQVPIGVTIGFIRVVIFAALPAPGGILHLFAGSARAQISHPPRRVPTRLSRPFLTPP